MSCKETVMDLASELLHELKNTSKRWFVLFLITLILLFTTNILWLYAWNNLNSHSETITVDSMYGAASYIGGNGSILNCSE